MILFINSVNGRRLPHCPSDSNKSATCDHSFGISGALPLIYNILVGDRPSNYDVLLTIGLHTATTEMSKLWHTSKQDGEFEPVKLLE